MAEQSQQQPSPLLTFLTSSSLTQIAATISPRISHLLSSLTLIDHTLHQEYSQEQLEHIDELFQSIEFPQLTSSSPMCRVNNAALKYYRCFDCQLSTCKTSFCENCFGDKHANHNFRVVSNSNCSCGNEELVKKQHFCNQHNGKGMKEGNQGMSNKQIDIFQKQTEFLLFVGVRTRSICEISPQKAQYLSFKALYLLAKLCSCYAYTKATSQLFLRPFRELYQPIGADSILHHIMWSEWRLGDLNKLLAIVLNQLYSHEKMRRAVIIEYFNLVNSPINLVLDTNPLTDIRVQYFYQGKLIIKLLKEGLIRPLQLAQNSEHIDAYTQIYQAYRGMYSTKNVKDILEISLRQVDFSKFSNFSAIEQNQISGKLTQHYLIFLKIVLLSIQDMETKRETELKIIRECYRYIKIKAELFNYCHERTLALCVFSLFGCTLQPLSTMNSHQLIELFGESNEEDLRECLQKMLENYFRILIIENYKSYRQLITDKKFALNTINYEAISIDFIGIRLIVTILRSLYTEVGIRELIPLRMIGAGKREMLEKWIRLYRAEKIKRGVIAETGNKAQVDALFNTGLFIRTNDQISGITIEYVSIMNNLLFACESSLCETIMANALKKHHRDATLSIYREYASLHPQKNRLEFKQGVEGLLYNPELLKEFIVKEHDGYFRGERDERYESSLSFCNLLFKDEISDSSTLRLQKKLQFGSSNPLTNFLYQQPIIKNYLGYANIFFNFLTTISPQEFAPPTAMQVSFNVLLESLLLAYLEIPLQALSEFVIQAMATEHLYRNFTDYTHIISKAFLEAFIGKKQVKGVEGEEDVEMEGMGKGEKKGDGRRESARARSKQKMKAIKEMQERFLEDHSSMVEVEEGDSCIICKTGSQEQPLNYLCKMRFSNNLPLSVLKSDKPMLVITTCGHKIHEKCLADNIDPQDEHGTSYKCFLCKHPSNLRLPLKIEGKVEGFLPYFLTILSLEISSNTLLELKFTEYMSLPNICRLLYQGIVLAVYLYNSHLPNFYASHILPITSTLITILQNLSNSNPPPPSVGIPTKDGRLKLVEQKLNQVIHKQTEKPMPIGELREYQEGLNRLFSNPPQPPLSLAKNIAGLKFFALPKDLWELGKLSDRCVQCRKLHSKMFICFLCGFKSCTDCASAMTIHIQLHLGSSVLIQIDTGRYHFRYRNVLNSLDSLYVNYAGEEFGDEGVPARGEYELNQERVERMIDAILNDEVQSRVEQTIRSLEGNPNCNVQ